MSDTTALPPCCTSNVVVPLRLNSEARCGAAAFRELCRTASEIGDATYDRFGEDVDGVDYAAIVNAIRASIDANLRDKPAAHSEGYLRALADLICTNVYGGALDVINEEWDPIKRTRLAYNTQRA